MTALDRFAREQYGRSVMALALRWVLDTPGVGVALWGARSPEQLQPLDEALGWTLDAAGRQKVHEIVHEHVKSPVGPEFMAPLARVTHLTQ